MNGEQWLTVGQAAAKRGVPEDTVYSAIRRGSLAATKHAGLNRRLIRVADVEAWVIAPWGGVRPNSGRKVKKEPTDGND